MFIYNFSSQDGALRIQLVSDQSERLLFYPSLERINDKLNIKEAGTLSRSFLFSEIGTIDGITHTDLNNAGDLITTLIKSIKVSASPSLTNEQLRDSPVVVRLSNPEDLKRDFDYSATNYSTLVANYPSVNTNKIAYVYQSQGVKYVNQKTAGHYIFDGTAWQPYTFPISADEILKVDTQLTQPLTNTQLRANPIDVNVVNQIDLTTITSYLLAIKNSVANIDVNTDTVEQKITDTITAINTNGTVNHSDLLLILTQLQAVNANTDTLEAGLTSILNKIIVAPSTLAEQQTQTSNQTNSEQKAQILVDQYDTYAPEENGTVMGQIVLPTDPSGDLKVRAKVLTDEGSLRFDFINQAQFDNNFVSNTPITVSNSTVVLGSGTTAITKYLRFNNVNSDYSPFRALFYGSVSQRIANKEIKIGLTDNPDTPIEEAYFSFTGTNNTLVTCITKSGTGASNTETSNVIIPSGATSASTNIYEIHHSGQDVDFLINKEIVATHSIHIPDSKTILSPFVYTVNSATVTNTNVTVDLISFENLNKVEITNGFNGQPINVEQFGNQHRIYGRKSLSATTADQVLLQYTVPSGKTMYLLGYKIESDTRGGLVKIGKATLTTEPTNAFELDGNFVEVFNVVNTSATANNTRDTNYSIPIRVAYSGETFSILVTQNANNATIWRASVQFILK